MGWEGPKRVVRKGSKYKVWHNLQAGRHGGCRLGQVADKVTCLKKGNTGWWGHWLAGMG